MFVVVVVDADVVAAAAMLSKDFKEHLSLFDCHFMPMGAVLLNKCSNFLILCASNAMLPF